MRKTLLFILLSMTCLSQAQEIPSKPANGFAFPIGTKFTLKLVAVDSIHFDCSVIAMEHFDRIVDPFDHEDLFEKTGNDSTITFYFCLGTHGETEVEKKENTQVLLLMKNYTKFALKYSSDIQRKQNGKFESTSNVGTFPGAMGMEMWPYMIYTIGLNSFEKYR